MDNEKHVAFDLRDKGTPPVVVDMMRISEIAYVSLSELIRNLMTSGEHPMKIVGGLTAAMGKTMGKLAVMDAIVTNNAGKDEEMLDDLMETARANAMTMIIASRSKDEKP